MTKINLVIASILKPVDDTRMYEKIGITLADSNKYSVHIVGFKTTKPVSYPNIIFYPLYNFHRLSWNRFTAAWKYYKILIKVKPKVIIVESPEILIVTTMYKILFGVKIYYDVLENYYYNILYISSLPKILKYLAAGSIRGIEIITSPFVDKYFLAEKIYQEQLPFASKKNAVLENKYIPLYNFLDKSKKRSFFHLLYTGTISKTFGVYSAIDLVIKLNELDSRFHLTIIGYCADTKEYNNLVSIISKYCFINVIGGSVPVPHSLIIKEISKGGIGIVAYQNNKAISGKMPTKLYEYIYNQLPMIIPPNALWIDFTNGYESSLAVNYSHLSNLDLHNLLQLLITKDFYNSYKESSSILWDYTTLLGNID